MTFSRFYIFVIDLFSASAMKWFKNHSKTIPVIISTSERDLKCDVDGRALAEIRDMCAFASEGVVNAKTSHDDSASRETQQRFESAKRMSLELANHC